MTTKKRKSTVKLAAIYAPPGDRKTAEAKKAAPPSKPSAAPKPAVRFCYRLAQHTVERSTDGWWIIVESGRRQGPFATPQDICVAIARAMCAELSNRHQSLAGFHGVGPGHLLYGLPDPPKLTKPGKTGAAS